MSLRSCISNRELKASFIAVIVAVLPLRISNRELKEHLGYFAETLHDDIACISNRELKGRVLKEIPYLEHIYTYACA